MTDQTTTRPTIDELLAQADEQTRKIEALTRKHDYYVQGHRGKYASSNPTDKQVRQLCKGFLLTQPGKTFDGITAMRALQEAWGISLDWHELSNALDELHTRGQARVTKGSGMTEYIILPFGDAS